ncbi:MAG: hypothetical protein KKD01_20030 [Proteobacteria bacterium]|nr:hypothetical protein [Pseudomonadota bacterium]
MMDKPFYALFKSRKFWLLILDTVVSVTLFFVGKYYQVAYEDIAFMIGALQPVFVTVIGGIAYEDGQLKRNQ